MKSFATLLLAAVIIFTTFQGFVVTMYDNGDCTGNSRSRNVYENSCAFNDGFQSFMMTINGGNLQQLTACSRQACAGSTTYQGYAAGFNSIALSECIKARNDDGGSNALSSYSSSVACPN